jgi:single-strand DNA-binding protein
MQMISIVGNVGKDAELKRLQDGTPVASWSVAVANRKEGSTWYSCSIFGNRATGIAPHIRKGDKIAVMGSLDARVYDGKPDLKVNVSEVTLCGGKRDDAARSEPQASYAAASGGNPIDDEIPF